MTQKTKTPLTKTLRRGLLVGSALASIASPALAAVEPANSGFETGDFSEFSQTGVSSGTLDVVSDRAAGGTHAAHASYTGGGANGYLRTIRNINWSADDDVWYGASYYLPEGYVSKVAGGNDILRWDNYGAFEQGADYGAIQIGGDGKTRAILGHYQNDPGTQLTEGVDLPEGRWFQLQVHQKFSTADGQALTEIYIDGQKVASSNKANTYGRGADRLRNGIVAIHEGQQTQPLDLWFDDVFTSPTQVGAKGGAPTAAAPGRGTAGAPAAPAAPGAKGGQDAAAAPAAPGDPLRRLSSMERHGLSSFDQAHATKAGKVRLSRAKAYDGKRSAKLTSKRGALARGVYSTAVDANADVTYGGAYFLPKKGFKGSVQGGGMDMLRWDNFGAFGKDADYGGIHVAKGGARGKLRVGKLADDPKKQLGHSFKLPTGRWFWLEVHQKLSTVKGEAVSEVFIDGKRVSSSTQPNSFGRPIDRVRYGIVDTDERQSKSLSMYMDRASLSTKLRGARASASR